jgi:hypothetical protein
VLAAGAQFLANDIRPADALIAAAELIGSVIEHDSIRVTSSDSDCGDVDIPVDDNMKTAARAFLLGARYLQDCLGIRL